MPGILENKVAIITGASSGIGRAAAGIYAREGARLVLADINAEGGEAVGAEIRAAGGEAIFVATDVSKEADITAMVSAALSQYGQLDTAFNNAGAGLPPKFLTDYAVADWVHAFEINLLSIALCMKAQIPAMLEAGGGSIVNVSSNSAIRAVPNISAYAAAKAGILGVSRMAALEYGARKIRVNVISPGLIGVKTTRDRDWAKELRIPMGRAGEFSEVGELAAFLSSDRASYISAQVISVDGGATA